MIHTIRLVRTGVFLAISLVSLSAVGGLLYLNQVGFPGQYGEWIREELGKKGIHLTFDTLHFDLREGLVATGVSFFEDRDHENRLLEAEEIMLDLDKTKAMRGTFKLLGLRVIEGTARVPVTRDGRILQARGLSGKLAITSKGRAVIREASGVVEGIAMEFSADLVLPDSSMAEEDIDPDQISQTDRLVGGILDELARWDLSAETPPLLSFHIEGDLNQLASLQTSFEFSAQNLSRNDYRLESLALSGDLQSELATLDQILLEDDTGAIFGRIDWSLRRRNGRFDLSSNIDLQRFLRKSFGQNVLEDLTLSHSPLLNLRGTYSLPAESPLSVKATGSVDLHHFTYQETPFESLSTDLSWSDGDLFLRDLKLSYLDQSLSGNFIAQGEEIRFDFRSTLPLEAFDPLIKPGSGLERALAELTFAGEPMVDLDLVGSVNRQDPGIWSARGRARLENFAFKGTKVHHLKTDFQLSQLGAGFTRLRALLNDEGEEARTRNGGQASGELAADRILFDSKSKFIFINNLHGTVWPTPIVRIFAPKTARHLRENYQFHETPKLTLNGRFAGRREDLDRTTFTVAIRTTGQTDYPFLGSDLPLQDLRADVEVEGRKIVVKNISASTLEGTMGGSVTCRLQPDGDASYEGSLKWEKLSFRRLSQVYQFDKEEKGSLTGSIDFRGSGASVRNFNANGIVAINGGNLVSLPVLGPLSPLIAGLLGDKRMGYERAKDASANFAVRKGVLQTKDFVAISTSIILTGEGWIDLLTEKMDMVIRVNARGLLGFLTLPLQPLKGIFQFRGAGTFSEPQWRSAPFTRPARGNNDPIFREPGRAAIVPD